MKTAKCVWQANFKPTRTQWNLIGFDLESSGIHQMWIFLVGFYCILSDSMRVKKGSFGSLWGFHLIWFECVGFGLGYLNWWQTTIKRILFVKKRGFLYIVSNSINFLKREHCHQKSTKCKNAISKCPFNIHHCTGFQKHMNKHMNKKEEEKYGKV